MSGLVVSELDCKLALLQFLSFYIYSFCNCYIMAGPLIMCESTDDVCMLHYEVGVIFCFMWCTRFADETDCDAFSFFGRVEFLLCYFHRHNQSSFSFFSLPQTSCSFASHPLHCRTVNPHPICREFLQLFRFLSLIWSLTPFFWYTPLTCNLIINVWGRNTKYFLLRYESVPSRENNEKTILTSLISQIWMNYLSVSLKSLISRECLIFSFWWNFISNKIIAINLSIFLLMPHIHWNYYEVDGVCKFSISNICLHLTVSFC